MVSNKEETSMWDLIIENGIWILTISIMIFILLLLLRHYLNSTVISIAPAQLRRLMEANLKVFKGVIIVLGGLIIVLGVTLIAISLMGQDVTPALAIMGIWFREHGIRIFIIIGLAYVILHLFSALIPRLIAMSTTATRKGRQTRGELDKRIRTLSRIITQIFAIIIFLITSLMILSEIGIDITSILAGLGIVGIAVGFGAQYLVRDLIAGFFVYLENQYNIGDVIKVGDIAGGVEEISIRRTILRDLDGARHIIPHGEVRVLSNLTQDWSRAHINLDVAYKEDLDRVMALMKNTWETMAGDPNWTPFMKVKTPWLLRVDAFGNSGITIKMVGETQPIKQWDVMGEFRRRIKKVFDEEGIEIPWPHVKLYLGDDSVKKGLSK
jgi:small conductance mechanosensitive channel